MHLFSRRPMTATRQQARSLSFPRKKMMESICLAEQRTRWWMRTNWKTDGSSRYIVSICYSCTWSCDIWVSHLLSFAKYIWRIILYFSEWQCIQFHPRISLFPQHGRSHFIRKLYLFGTGSGLGIIFKQIGFEHFSFRWIVSTIWWLGSIIWMVNRAAIAKLEWLIY